MKQEINFEVSQIVNQYFGEAGGDVSALSAIDFIHNSTHAIRTMSDDDLLGLLKHMIDEIELWKQERGEA